MSINRPHWERVYGYSERPGMYDRQQLLTVTRESLVLAQIALEARQQEDGYGNRSQAIREIEEALATPQPAQNSGDWPEDFSHENGNYQCRCFNCGRLFNGYKRRVTCKICSEASRPIRPANLEQHITTILAPAVNPEAPYAKFMIAEIAKLFGKPSFTIQFEKPWGWLGNGRGDGWQENNVVTRDPEHAEFWRKSPHWVVQPLFVGEPSDPKDKNKYIVDENGRIGWIIP